MASSVWSTVQGSVPGGPLGMSSVTGGSDPTSLLNSQLASALSTMGDAQYWEDSISPTTIRTSFASSDPSNPNNTPVLLRGMKWLLACISKGRNVSDFYPHVVKLVGAPSLEVRKMVYMYLVQYADHDPTTRELSLLSINSFQRGLADSEQLIRALALRVLSSIRVSDVLQIQILGVQKCAKDNSPYVRKCAANALAKLSPRCDLYQRDMLMEIMTSLLDEDTSTMVLTSTIVAFAELCPERLELLHSCYRKVCHLLTDMDEWGQVVVIDTFARYCRQFFQKPKTTGSAEVIDQERRVRRTVRGIASASEQASVAASSHSLVETTAAPEKKPRPGSVAPRKIKRRVVKKGFYSDEDDESVEEEVYAEDATGKSLSVASAMRQRQVFGSAAVTRTDDADEDNELDEDHRLVLRSSLPLLKSRNSGVVLAVCSLHYYCGVASVKVRSALGKALVRIHRDRREIQYVVLTSIRTLVTECPSAFTPFLNDFFVKAMDPSYTRMIKLDIMSSLALEPASIEAVLKEMRTYIRHDDKEFVCASIRTVGKVVELARIVHDRYGEKAGDPKKERSEANRVAVNCLYGLMALTKTCEHEAVVGECAIVMQRIMVQLMSDSNETGMSVDDPNGIQDMAIERLVLLLVRSLSSRTDEEETNQDDNDDEKVESELDALTVKIPPNAVASALWIVGDCVNSLSRSHPFAKILDEETKSKMRLELVRLVAKSFPNLEPCEKLEGVHFASKLLISASSGRKSAGAEVAICEHVLSMGRADTNTDVRDRSRYESAVVHISIGLKHDTDLMTPIPSISGKLSLENAKSMLLRAKPPSSSLPLQDEAIDRSSEFSGPFRFGTLSSLVSHRARTAYLPLPKWAEKNSPDSIRDPPTRSSQQGTQPEEVGYGRKVGKEKKIVKATKGGFYDSDGDDSTSSSNSENADSSSAEGDNDGSSSDDSSEDSSSDESSEDDSDSESDDESKDEVPTTRQTIMNSHPVTNGGSQGVPTMKANALVDVASSASESDSDDTTDDSDSSSDTSKGDGNLLPISSFPDTVNRHMSQPANGSSLVEGLEGLVMAPVVVDVEEKADPNLENDSGLWIQLVRPELGGGLIVSARYLRGPTREREAKLLGLDPNQPTTICLQVKFENRRTDAGVLRRVRIIQRSSPSGSISTRRVVVPPEIAALKKGQMTTAILGMDFQSASDREGSLQARFEVKSDRGSNPVDIRPPLGELLRPCRMNRSDFKASIDRMHGFQRVVSSFTLSSGTHGSIDAAYKALPRTVLKYAALTPLEGKVAWNEGTFSLAATLSASLDNVYVIVDCDPKTGTGSITVCCNLALAANSLVDLLKRSITT